MRQEKIHKIWNRAMECMDRAKLRELQNERLRKTVELEYANVPLYRARMDAMGVKKGIRNPRIDVLAIAGRHGLQVYGSGMDVKKEGKDNTINISRNEIDLL